MVFPIRRVERRRGQQTEQLGSKPKYWFREDDRRLLFKAENRGTGEDWAEVVACRLCGLLGIPHVEYHLAAEYDGGEYVRPGVVCQNMAPPPKELILGNQLLVGFDSNYPGSERSKVRQHTVDAVCEIVSMLRPPENEWMSGATVGTLSALGVFVGYVMLDTWIANQDRHHENWGAIWDGSESDSLFLAPTFDHGSGLARNLMDAEREKRLATRDRNYSIPGYAAKGRSVIFGSPGESKPLFLLDAFLRFAARSPGAAIFWLSRLQAIASHEISAILEDVPEERMSPICKQFTLELLETNRGRLLELKVVK